MKVHFEVIPTVSNILATIAEQYGITGDALEARVTNICFSELGKINAERKEAKDGKTAGLWASLKLRKGAFSGAQKQTQVLMLEDGQHLNTRVFDLYVFSAAVVKLEEQFGGSVSGEFVTGIPLALHSWFESLAKALKEEHKGEKVGA